MNSPADRLGWLDVAKGLGIILVVVGHVLLLSPSGSAQYAAASIYLFHMPLFFLLAGATLRSESWRPFTCRKTLALLLPYVFFLLALGLPSLLTTCGWNVSVPGLGIDRCSVMVAKLLLGGSMLGGIFGVFWFIPCLLFALIMAQFLLGWLKGKGRLIYSALLLALLAIGYAIVHLVPSSTALLALGVTPVAAALVLVGYASFSVTKPSSFITAAALLTGAIVIAAMVPVDMKHGVYGMPLIGLAGAVALSMLLVRLSHAIALVPWLAAVLQFLGQRTLVILYLHQAVHLTLRQATVANDTLLILASLAIPLLLHGPINWLLAAAATSLSADLSRKSPPSSASLS